MEENRALWVSVAVDRPVDRLFTYWVPDSLQERIVPGLRVQVPFGKSSAKGMVVGRSGPPPRGITAKRVIAVLEDTPAVTSEVLSLLKWVSGYYGCPLGEVVRSCVPIRKEGARRETAIKPAVQIEVLKRLLKEITGRAPAQARILSRIVESPSGCTRKTLLRDTRASYSSLRSLIRRGFLREVPEEELGAETPPAPAAELQLSEAQKKAVSEIEEAISSDEFAPCLLFGVTGSGKTEVYLRAMERVVQSGGQGLVLLPEIALTPQTYCRFQQRFRGVVLQHSLLPSSQRAANLRLARTGKAQVVIGARSALFTPFFNLKLIVVDEEHETSFKQESSPHYNARDMAVVRAKNLRIPVVLGSATPSLESYMNARQGRYRLLSLPGRATRRGRPHVRMVDLTRNPKGYDRLSPELLDLTADVLSQGKQAMFFLNRRGYARVVRCLRCGYAFLCRNCSTTLTYHRSGEFLMCHTCGAVRPKPDTCPQCGMPILKFLGAGTQKVIKELRERFPSVRMGRLDRDIASSRRNLLSILRDFSERKLDLIVGTQMIAKGHDFPEVTLVGIICADGGLHLPDFRAAERTFQLIHQVTGRAGRGQEPGKVVVQTYTPSNRVIQLAIAGEYEPFAREELNRRKPLGYPPFGRILRIVARGKKEGNVRGAIDNCARALSGLRCPVLGPAPCPVERIRDRFRYQIIVKGKGPADVREALSRVKKLRFGKNTKASFDVDPVSFL